MTNIADMSLNQMADKVKKTAYEMQDKAKNKLHEVGEKAEEGLNESAEKIQQQVTDVNKLVHEYVHAKPLTALAIAAGVGALLGLLLSK